MFIPPVAPSAVAADTQEAPSVGKGVDAEGGQVFVEAPSDGLGRDFSRFRPRLHGVLRRHAMHPPVSVPEAGEFAEGPTAARRRGVRWVGSLP